MLPVQISIAKAGKDQKAQVYSMLLPYLQELGVDSNYPYFDSYWMELERTPYVFLLGHEIIGFCFIRLLKNNVHELAEFYIKPEFRRNGFGRVAAQKVLLQYSGAWTLSILSGNQQATRFWRNVLSGDIESFKEEIDHRGRDVITFKFNALS